MTLSVYCNYKKKKNCQRMNNQYALLPPGTDNIYRAPKCDAIMRTLCYPHCKTAKALLTYCFILNVTVQVTLLILVSPKMRWLTRRVRTLANRSVTGQEEHDGVSASGSWLAHLCPHYLLRGSDSEDLLKLSWAKPTEDTIFFTQTSCSRALTSREVGRTVEK